MSQTNSFGKATRSKSNVHFAETEEMAAVTAQVIGGSKDVNDAYARRIVACFNACAGLRTENLEDNVPVKELAKRYNKVIGQRDRYLDALNLIATSCDIDSLRAAIDCAMAAISKEVGGS